MKRSSLLVLSFVFTALFAVSAFSQGAAQPSAGTKIAVINTAAFDDDKGGITKYSNAMNALEKEFAPLQTEIQGLVTRYNTLGAEIKKLQDSANAPTPVPIDQKTAAAKVDEYQTLETTIKRKQEDGKTRFEKRQQEIMAPILQDIGKAMDDFAKQKGFALILDGAKLESAGLILAVDMPKIDVTKDFIVFYNARPAGTATTATPK
ncbi:MAG: OmpH family outer membrane protein [Pyrinomonadaceae bacterium]